MNKYILITFIIIFSCGRKDFYEGTVKDEFGNPLENVIVFKYDCLDVREVQTDKKGYFKLPRESYVIDRLTFVKHGYETISFLPIRTRNRLMFIKGDSTVQILKPCSPCKP